MILTNTSTLYTGMVSRRPISNGCTYWQRICIKDQILGLWTCREGYGTHQLIFNVDDNTDSYAYDIRRRVSQILAWPPHFWMMRSFQRTVCGTSSVLSMQVSFSSQISLVLTTLISTILAAVDTVRFFVKPHWHRWLVNPYHCRRPVPSRPTFIIWHRTRTFRGKYKQN